MRGKLFRSRQFRSDLITIYGHLHDQSPRAAERVIDAIEQTTRQLLQMPRSGRLWDSPDARLDGLRVVLVKPYRNYLIFYRVEGKAGCDIHVYRVLHGARDLEPIIDSIQFDED